MTEGKEPTSTFVRLGGAPAGFADEDGAVVYASYTSADHDDTLELLYDPLELIRKNDEDGIIGSADDGWTITVTRVNAEVAIPRPGGLVAVGGPHHHLCLWLVLPKRSSVALTTHRSQI